MYYNFSTNSQKIILIRRKATDIKYKFYFYLYLYSFLKEFILFLFVYVYVCTQVTVQEPKKLEEGMHSMRVRVTSGYESPNIGARN